MNNTLRISALSDKSIILKSIALQDQEILRTWKNKNKEYFFFKEEINQEMQQVWFNGYLRDPNNYMFIIEYNLRSVGCIGFKVTPEGADIYNVILGDDAFAKSGIMSRSMKIMCSYIIEKGISRIFLKVLQINRIAYEWYLKNSFNNKYSQEDYHFLELDIEKNDRCIINIV